MDRILRTRLHTGAAADTFRMVRRFQDIDIHLARRNTALASDAFITLDLDAEKGYLVKERVDCPQRADPFAERAVKQNAQHHDGGKNRTLEGEQLAQRRANARIAERQRDRPFQNALRADVFAEERVAHTDGVGGKHRQQDHKHDQNDVFEIAQRLELFCRELFAGDFVQQILQPTERA